MSVVLFEEESNRFLLNELDEKVWPIKDFFSSDLDEATMSTARKFIEDYLMLNDAVGLDVLAKELGIGQKAATRVFQVLECSGHFDVATIQGMGQFLFKMHQ